MSKTKQHSILMEAETSEETAGPSWKPVKELEKTALEKSTVKQVQSEKKGRQRLECLFCGAQYTGGPHDIRSSGGPWLWNGRQEVWVFSWEACEVGDEEEEGGSHGRAESPGEEGASRRA